MSAALCATDYNFLFVVLYGGCHEVGVTTVGKVQSLTQLPDAEWEVAYTDVGLLEFSQGAYVLFAQCVYALYDETSSGEVAYLLVRNE